MNRIEIVTKPLMWFAALMLVVVAAGCSSGGSTTLSSAKAITAYSLGWTTGTPGTATGTISGTASPYSIAVTVPSGTSKVGMIATFTTTGANVKVGTPAVTQVSATTPNDFTSPVVYTVTAANGTTVTYTVTVTVGAAVGPNLGLAAPFATAATTGLTNVGATTINGDVLMDPTLTCNTSSLTGSLGDFAGCGATAPTFGGSFHVFSTLYDPGANLTTIKSDLNVAFLSLCAPGLPAAACSLTGGTALATTSIGAVGSTMVQGQNYFVPGVYTSASTIDISDDITLDAQANPNAVFIFQAGTALNLTPGAAPPGARTRILLINGAKASNVWWSVGSSATIGSYDEFQGTVLAAVAVTMQTGATACGRLLGGAWVSGGGAATFGANIVSVPGQAFVPPAGYSVTCQ